MYHHDESSCHIYAGSLHNPTKNRPYSTIVLWRNVGRKHAKTQQFASCLWISAAKQVKLVDLLVALAYRHVMVQIKSNPEKYSQGKSVFFIQLSHAIPCSTASFVPTDASSRSISSLTLRRHAQKTDQEAEAESGRAGATSR